MINLLIETKHEDKANIFEEFTVHMLYPEHD